MPIDPVTVDVVAFDDHIPQVDTDAELEPLVFIGFRLSFGYPVLPRHRASESIHHTSELNKQAVTYQLDDPAMVLSDERLQDFLAQLGETPKRSSFVASHQPGIADHVCG